MLKTRDQAPVTEPERQYYFMDICSDYVKKLAKEHNVYMVKIDPNFCISDDSFKEKEVEHMYSENYQIKNNNLIKLGYKNTGLHKEMGKNLQPQSAWLVLVVPLPSQ